MFCCCVHRAYFSHYIIIIPCGCTVVQCRRHTEKEKQDLDPENRLPKAHKEIGKIPQKNAPKGVDKKCGGGYNYYMCIFIYGKPVKGQECKLSVRSGKSV